MYHVDMIVVMPWQCRGGLMVRMKCGGLIGGHPVKAAARSSKPQGRRPVAAGHAVLGFHF